MKTYTYSREDIPAPARISPYRLILACIIMLCLSFSVFAAPKPVPPVEFQSFTVTRESSRIVLNWEVKNRELVSHYIVESSLNGTDYSIAGYVFPNEDLTNGSSRFWAVPKKHTSVIYYRIRSVETNGTLTYSPNCELRIK